jgi:integrase/recombinase XerD
MLINLNSILQEYIKIRKENMTDYLFCNANSLKLKPRTLQDDIKKYNNARSILRTSIDAFRHTYTKMWVISGDNMFSLQRLLGHTTLEMTKQYESLYFNDSKINYNEFNPLEKLNNTNINIKTRKD